MFSSRDGKKVEMRIKCDAPFDAYQLNALDSFQSRFVFEVVYFFDDRLDEHQLTDKLRLLLKAYPYLAGRYKKRPDGSLNIVPCDKGLRFVVCHSDVNHTSPDDLSSRKQALDHLLEKINPPPFGNSPLFAAKLTHFAGKGSALGVAISHGLADAHGLFRIVSEWANIDLDDTANATTSGTFTKPPSIEGMVISDAERQDATRLYQNESRHGYRRLGWTSFATFMYKFLSRKSSIQSRVYRLSAAELSNMKHALSESPDQDSITQNDALSAHLWHLAYLLEQRCHKYHRRDRDTRHLLTIGSIRNSIDASITSDYLGNAVNPLLVSASRAQLSDDNPSPLALEIRGVSSAFTNEKLKEQILWLKMAHENGHMARIFSGNDPYRNDLFISSFVRCQAYSACFNGRAPRWVTPAPVPAPWVIQIMPAPDRAVDVHFYLYREVAELLDGACFQALLHRYQH